MSTSIDLDIGGTYTDCFIRFGDKVVIKKSPTTHYDISVGFKQCIEDGAAELGMDIEEMLSQTDVIRYSTTLGTNALIERTGPKLGLITTAGHEDVIYIGRLKQWADGLSYDEVRNRAKQKRPNPLIPRDMTVGLRERVDCFGNIIIPLKKEEIREKLQYLVDRGAMGFVISLIYSVINPAHEKMVRDVIQEEYPDYYLGNMPVLLSSDVCPTIGEYPRAMTTIVSTYVHQEMADKLAELSNEMRNYGYKKPLIMVQNSGGTARLNRTTAVNTHNAGPVAGALGSAYLSKYYGENLIFSDMGGTSFDVATIIKGQAQYYDFLPLIDRWRVSLYAVETTSIGAGGGSIAWIDPVYKNLKVGPRGAGSLPGPVCYDLGGTEPTVTDADLVLGYIDPSYYLGGKITLNREKAEEALRQNIADPLGISTVEAAVAIKQIVDANMGNEIFKMIALKGHDPRSFSILACGGAGATHCCGYNEQLKAPKIITLPFAPVFCAFGASTADIVHSYSASKFIVLQDHHTQQYFNDFNKFNETIKKMQSEAIRDMKEEGFAEENVYFTLALEVRYGTQVHTTRINSPCLEINSEDDVKKICEAFNNRYGELYSPTAAYPEGGVEITTFTLKAVCPSSKFSLTRHLSVGTDASNAQKGSRQAYWPEYNRFEQTNVYEYTQLSCGNVIEGPAIVESAWTTYVIPPGKRFTIDQYLNGVIDNIDQ